VAGIACLVVLWRVHIGWQEEDGLASLLAQLCQTNGRSSAVSGIAAPYALWATMSLAMMLPSAVPMISTYLDIADAAARSRQSVVRAGFLVAGYGAVWLVFAAAATCIQALVELTPALALANRTLAAGLLIVAGLYQFAPIKHACLAKCRAPMPYFLAHWSDKPLAVFRMGAEQGALCLMCCWALMLLMLAAGLMNVLWMAGLTLLVILEKTLPKPKAVIYGSGAGLIVAGTIALFGS
jgi:predicted metal-binding membrane protein